MREISVFLVWKRESEKKININDEFVACSTRQQCLVIWFARICCQGNPWAEECALMIYTPAESEDERDKTITDQF